MPGNFKKEDLRVSKTYRALTTATLMLLNKRNSQKITVNALCEEALISRSTFYTHFTDKYDLLRYYLTVNLQSIPDDESTHNESDIITEVNLIVQKHKEVMNTELCNVLKYIIELKRQE